ncbi:protein NPAT isoform X2 [Oryzias melastigma]|uniref:protein NPAT isoform X2 n=1 Tax=Oryzias melastigma TaxID=30732 RepID=UPI000CF82485|nr:protein NPAT isoform X2 [Oryzias melastigma]
MLLPSDVARLVLGYLQEEGLSATSQAFIHESPNLKEYAEHTIGDGTVPACVFSIFGKGLTTILNEYVAAKAKESSHEVPLVMTSLWKKLDFTLNQIKSLQNSPAISASQRTRSRIGVANMARQRALTAGSVSGIICSSAAETSSMVSPAHTSHTMLGHSTPVCITGPHVRQVPNGVTQQHQVPDISRIMNTPRDSPVQVIISENRLTSGPMSPGRRKWDTPRKRGGGPGGSSGPNRSAPPPVGSVSTEPQPEEAVDENFPQLVIQNARDKILGDRSLQEKLAENINKILANEPVPQTSKASVGTVEADQSIDEILGLQGEIHMSDDAIHDILEQTESDPAFQALFDLFDYNKTRFPDGEMGDVDVSSSPEEMDSTGPSSMVRVLQNNDPDPVQQLQENPPVAPPVTLKTKAVQERKTRKSTASVLLKKTVIDSSGRSSRIENSSARLLVSHGEHRGSSSATVDPKRKEKPSHQNINGGDVSMEISEPTPSPSLSGVASGVHSEENVSSSSGCISNSVSSSKDSAVPEETPGLNVDKNQTRGSNEKNSPPFLAVNEQLALASPLGVQENSSQSSSLQSSVSVLGIGSEALPESTVSVMSFSTSCTVTSASTSLVSIPVSGSATSASASVPPAPPSSTLSSPGCYPAANPTTPIKAPGDSSNVMSLKIIISDNQDEDSSMDTTLNRAISGISVDKIPTIYLSSQAKSPGGPGTPKVNFDEAAQAVRGLQSSEAFGSPARCRAGAIATSLCSGTPQPQRYLIQLPVDPAKPAVQESPASYFLVTPTPDVQAKQVPLPSGVLGQPLTSSPFGVTTPGQTQSFSPGSTLILPSVVNPVVLPVSVVGQNTLGKVQLVSNQLVDVPNPIAVQPMETVKPVTVAAKPPPTPNMSDKSQAAEMVQPETTDQLDAAKGPSHKRILCFESSSSSKTLPCNAKTTDTTNSKAPNPSGSKSIPPPSKDKRQPATRTKPNILGGNKPKRRIEPIRCSGGALAEVSSLKDTVPVLKQQKESLKNTSSNSQEVQNSETEAAKKSELGETSQSSDKSVASAEETKAKNSRSLRSLSSDVSGSRKDKEDGRKEAAGKSREGRTEKRTPSQEAPNVTANKENEMKQQQVTTSSSSESRDFSPPAVSQLTPNPQPKAAKAPSKTSSLAKQAAEMLQDIQGQKSSTTPTKKPGTGSSNPSVNSRETPANSPRTPSHPKKGKDLEGTPKHQLTPNTPDVPTCSPASEAGSENSINMAAHTLMILSRAAIARTGTPLKDSLRQDEAGQKSPASTKTKKRKAPSPTETPPSKRELKQSPSKKKDRERKKLTDCFPHDLDVDKFLSSLHYDE